MLRRLKTLVAMLLPNKKIFKATSKPKLIARFFISVMFVAIVGAVYYVLLYLFKNIIYVSTSEQIVFFILSLFILLSILLNIGNISTSLYEGKDNQILFCLPVKHNEIFISKMIVFFIDEFVKGLFSTLPLMFAYGLIKGMTFGLVINSLLLIILIPMLTVFVSSLLSIPIFLIKRFLKEHAILNALTTTAIFSAIVYLVYKILQHLPRPLRIIALYNAFVQFLSGFIAKFNSAMYVIKDYINVLFEGRTFINYLVILSSLIALGLIVYLVAIPFYFSLINPKYGKKKKIKIKRNADKKLPIKNSFIKKEFLHITKDSSQLTSYIISILAFPVLLYVINTIFSAINTSALGDRLIITFNMVIGLVLLTSNNTSCATAISREGLEFQVLKTAPSNTSRIIIAKILAQSICTFFAIVLGFVVLKSVTLIDNLQLLMLCAVYFLISYGHMLGALQYDVIYPKINDYAQTGDINKNKSLSKTMLSGVLISLIAAAIVMFFFLDSYFGGWVRILAFSAAYLLIKSILLSINVKILFKRIEM